MNNSKTNATSLVPDTGYCLYFLLSSLFLLLFSVPFTCFAATKLNICKNILFSLDCSATSQCNMKIIINKLAETINKFLCVYFPLAHERAKDAACNFPPSNRKQPSGISHSKILICSGKIIFLVQKRKKR